MQTQTRTQTGVITQTIRGIVEYERDDISELGLSYAITIHKSQGSEFGAIIIPVLTQHF